MTDRDRQPAHHTAAPSAWEAMEPRRGSTIGPAARVGYQSADARQGPAGDHQARRPDSAAFTSPAGSAAGKPGARPPVLGQLVRLLVSVAGAAGAALFARASFVYYADTHRLIGGAYFVEEAWLVVAFLIRRKPRTVSRHLGNWLLAAGATFGGLLVRPAGAHYQWGVNAGLGLQLAGVAVAIMSLLALGRSFGLVAADRGLVTRGPYAVIRHPLYAAYLLIGAGYLLQTVSGRNVAVLAFVTGCNIGRAIAEERLLASSSAYESYQKRVRWRLLPGVW